MTWQDTRSKIATTLKSDPNADVTELRRQMRAEHLAAYVERVVSEAPPLSDEQKGAIAQVLQGGGTR